MTKIKCNSKTCKVSFCVHLQPHTELGNCTTPNICESTKEEVRCVPIKQASMKKEEEIQEAEKYGFCTNSRTWIDFTPRTSKNCSQLLLGEASEPIPACGTWCEHYELREPNLYLTRKLKKLEKEKKEKKKK